MITATPAHRHGHDKQENNEYPAIIVKVKDKKKIGGAYLNSEAICYTRELAKDGSYKVGEVSIYEDSDDPKRQTFLEGKNQ